MTRCALAVFARAPTSRGVKTRLVPALGAAGAAALYEHLLRRTLALARAAPVATCAIYVDAPTSLLWFADVAGVQLHVQSDGDLGQRMAHALTAMLATHDAALLIGSDLADATRGDLGLAARWLDADAEVVLGPAGDGGYWLVGARGRCPPIFDGLAWSTRAVYGQTIARLAAARVAWRALPVRHDVDEVSDLVHLA